MPVHVTPFFVSLSMDLSFTKMKYGLQLCLFNSLSVTSFHKPSERYHRIRRLRMLAQYQAPQETPLRYQTSCQRWRELLKTRMGKNQK
jgi:hypothetical protein